MGENLQAVDKPEEVRLIVSKDNMSAFISFSEPINSDVRIKSDVIKKLLAEKGIVTGIFNKVIETLTTGEKEYEKEYLIAKGVEAVDGKNGSLKYLFDTGAGSHKPKVKDGGRVDYRDLDLFKLVNEGDVLVRVIPPSQGEDGVDIKNNIVKAKPGTPVRNLPRGKNIIISEDKKEIIAKSSGYISFVNNKINISPILEIHGDVGNSTGDIVFNGAVNISGNVLNGFSVTADGDITVNGVVEGAAISSGSHVFLKNGVQGMDKAVIKSGGDIIAKYIEHSEVVAGNNIAAESIMHSKVTCYGQLGLYGKNASLIGGATSVKSYVKAKYIGSPMSTVTEIRVGNDPLMVSEYERLSRQMNDYRQALLKEEERLEKLNRLLESAPNNEKVQNSIDSAMSSKTYVEEQVLDTENELRSVIGKLSGKKGFVVAENKVYPGVKIIIGNSMLIIKEEMERVTLYNSENGIKISNLP